MFLRIMWSLKIRTHPSIIKTHVLQCCGRCWGLMIGHKIIRLRNRTKSSVSADKVKIANICKKHLLWGVIFVIIKESFLTSYYNVLCVVFFVLADFVVLTVILFEYALNYDIYCASDFRRVYHALGMSLGRTSQVLLIITLIIWHFYIHVIIYHVMGQNR